MKNKHKRLIRELEIKATPKRLAILAALEKEKRYLSPEDVWGKVKAGFPSLGLPTVYRNLEEMAQGGLISKIYQPDRRLYYYFCDNQDHHHHFVCDSCRKVEDLAACLIEPLEKEVRRSLRAKVKSHSLQINGTCQACLKGGK